MGRMFVLMRRIKRYFFLRAEFWNEYFTKGEYELKVIGQYVDPKKVSIDIGGNIGVYTYHLARLSKQVFTFEPNEQYVSVIRDLCLGNAIVEQVALSDQSGVVELLIPRLETGREDRGMATIQAGVLDENAISRRISVPRKTLDDYAITNVGFIKIDVEGHEEGVLRGGWATISQNRPPVLIEIEERHNPGGIARIANLMATLDYQGYFYKDGQRRPFADFDAATMQDVSRLQDHGAGRRHASYINNFLFLPRQAAAA